MIIELINVFLSMMEFIFCIIGLIYAPFFTIGCILIHYDWTILGWCFIIYSIYKYLST